MDRVDELRMAIKETEKERHLDQCKRYRKLITLRLEIWSILINPKLEMSTGTLLEELKDLGWDLYDLSDYLGWRNINPKDESLINGSFYESTELHLLETIERKCDRLKLPIINDASSNLKNTFIQMLCIFMHLKNLPHDDPEATNKSKTEVIALLSKILKEEGKGPERFTHLDIGVDEEPFNIPDETKSPQQLVHLSRIQQDQNFLNSLNAIRSSSVQYIDHLLTLVKDREKNLIHWIFHLKWGKKILLKISDHVIDTQNEELFQDKMRNYYHVDLIVTKLLVVFRQIDGTPDISIIWSQNCTEEEAARCALKLGELRNILKDEEP